MKWFYVAESSDLEGWEEALRSSGILDSWFLILFQEIKKHTNV